MLNLRLSKLLFVAIYLQTLIHMLAIIRSKVMESDGVATHAPT